MFQAKYLFAFTKKTWQTICKHGVCKTDSTVLFSQEPDREPTALRKKQCVCSAGQKPERETCWHVFIQTRRNWALPHQLFLPQDTAWGILEVTKPSGFNPAPKLPAIQLEILFCLGHLILTESWRGAATSEVISEEQKGPSQANLFYQQLYWKPRFVITLLKGSWLRITVWPFLPCGAEQFDNVPFWPLTCSPSSNIQHGSV